MRLAAALLVALSAHPAFGAGGGSSGAEFLRVAMGARPAGLGESFTGLADDVTAASWNPAGLGQLDHPEFSAMHLAWFSDISYEYLAGSFPVGSAGSLAVSAAYVNVPPFDSTAAGSGEAKGTAADGMAGLSWGGSFAAIAPGEPGLAGLYYGLTAKVIYRSLGGYAPAGGTPQSYSAIGGAADIGLLYRAAETFTMGVSFMNLGTPLTFLKDEADAMPVTLRGGIGWRAYDGGPLRVTVLGDVAKPVDPDGGKFTAGTWGGAGLEVTGFSLLSLRGGYRIGPDGGRVVGGLGVTWGVVSIDGAFVPMGNFGNTWRAGITFKFGVSERRLPAVQDLTAESVAGGKVSLKWMPVYGAAGYHVEVLTPTAAEFKRLTKEPREAPEMMLGKLKGGSRYRFRVLAVAASGVEGEPAETDLLTPDEAPPFPAGPAKLNARIAAGRLELSWTPVVGATGYHVWFRPSDGKWKQLTKTPRATPSISLKGVKGGMTEFSVESVGPGGKKGKSTEMEMMVPSSWGDAAPAAAGGAGGEPAATVQPAPAGEPPFPAAPVKLNARIVAGRLLLSWTPVPGTTGYHVWFRPSGGKWVKFTKEPCATTEIALAGVAGGMIEFSVVSVGPGGTKGKSREMEMMVPSSWGD